MNSFTNTPGIPDTIKIKRRPRLLDLTAMWKKPARYVMIVTALIAPPSSQP